VCNFAQKSIDLKINMHEEEPPAGYCIAKGERASAAATQRARRGPSGGRLVTTVVPVRSESVRISCRRCDSVTGRVGNGAWQRRELGVAQSSIIEGLGQPERSIWESDIIQTRLDSHH
jgi:hypothetical protein